VQTCALPISPPLASMDRLDRKQVKTERIVRQHARFDAALDADEDRLGVRPRLDQRLGEREGRHEVAAGAAAGEKHPHRPSPPKCGVRSEKKCGMWNAECGMYRRASCGTTSPFNSAFRIPHSAFLFISCAALARY